jgi:hypothetical protein
MLGRGSRYGGVGSRRCHDGAHGQHGPIGELLDASMG